MLLMTAGLIAGDRPATAPGTATGILPVHHGDREVGELCIKTPPGKFSVADKGLGLHRDGGKPLSDDNPGGGSPQLAPTDALVHPQQGEARRPPEPTVSRGSKGRLPGWLTCHRIPRLARYWSGRRQPQSSRGGIAKVRRGRGRRLATDSGRHPAHGGGLARSGRGAWMSKWNYQAMGEVGLTGWRRQAAQPAARLIAHRTGRPESEIFSLIGAGFLMITLIDFLRTVDDVIAAGRAGPRPADGLRQRQGRRPTQAGPVNP